MRNVGLAALSGFIAKAPATAEAISRLKAGVPYPLPDDYVDLLRSVGDGEGFVGEQFVRFYSVDEVLLVRHVLGEVNLAGDLVIVGSNGAGEALAYDYRESAPRLVMVGFIPLDYKFIKVLAGTLSEYLQDGRPSEARKGSFLGQTARARTPVPGLIGKEIHHIKPIIFGGDPVDPQNKQAVTLSEYMPLVVWWNRLYRDTKNREGTGSGTNTA